MEQIENRALEMEPLFHPLEKIYLDRLRMMEREWPDQINIVLQTFKVGDLGVAAIPFEVFAETGLEIKDRSPFADNFTIGLANGYYGYIPTPEQHEVGGYETWLTSNKVEINATRKKETELTALFNQVNDISTDE